MRIKQWWIEKGIENWNVATVVDLANREDSIGIVNETEKAYRVVCSSDYGTVTIWVPKSCTMTEEEWEAEQAAEMERSRRYFQRMEEGRERLEKLIAWAKEQGVKGVRIGLRKATVLKKIEEAGLVAPEF